MLLKGNCLDKLKEIKDNSVDSIVTDPPYELGFMGKAWDKSGIAYDVNVWKECLRVLKPGGYLLSFGGSRTYHRMACAIEDAGFEIRDQIMWVYGSGFPKSLDISKAIEGKLTIGSSNPNDFKKLNGEIINKSGLGYDKMLFEQGARPKDYKSNNENKMLGKLNPKTKEAKQWDGWGTALKPAHEPIVVARKPLSEKTVADNVLKWGTGGINIDASRIATTDDLSGGTFGGIFGPARDENGKLSKAIGSGNKGRFPANFIHDGLEEEWAKFFYCSKASKKDRNEGLDLLDKKIDSDRKNTDKIGSNNPRNRTSNAKTNFHPTVKPNDLMAYLIKLITKPKGIVLDPFLGSGSTAKAAILNDFKWIGIELNEEYYPIIEARVEYAKNKVKEKKKKNGK